MFTNQEKCAFPSTPIPSRKETYFVTKKFTMHTASIDQFHPSWTTILPCTIPKQTTFILPQKHFFFFKTVLCTQATLTSDFLFKSIVCDRIERLSPNINDVNSDHASLHLLMLDSLQSLSGFELLQFGLKK